MLLLALCIALTSPAFSQILLEGGLLADGTGSKLRPANLRITSGRISQIGKLTPLPNEQILSVKGLIVAPGFIDMHSHADGSILKFPHAEAALRQGITTILTGQDGGSPYPFQDFRGKLEQSGIAINLASMIGHATLRRQVMGDNLFRPATLPEIDRMKALLESELAAGAFGLSTGLEYEAGHQATTDEIVALAQIAAARGLFYQSHVRDEANSTLQSFAEVVSIGERAHLPVQITHIKLGATSVWGKTNAVAQLHRQAQQKGVQLWADVYPYTYWHSTIRVLMPDRDFYNRPKVTQALKDNGGPQAIRLLRYSAHPAWNGQTLDAISRAENIAPEDLYMQIVRTTTDGASASILGTTIDETDLQWFIRQPWIAFCTDGGLTGGHPRGAGSYPRILAHYVREKKLISLPEAIRKMTSLPAARMNLTDRGKLAPGMAADIVVFDPHSIADRATIEDPLAHPTGIHHVLVNGQFAIRDGTLTTARPGRVLRAPPASHGKLK